MDSDKNKSGTIFENKKVIHYSELNEDYDYIFICSEYKDIFFNLKRIGVEDEKIICIYEELYIDILENEERKRSILDEEKFISEGFLFDSLANEGWNILTVNESIQICEYLEDGLSNHIVKVMLDSWSGTMLFFRNKINILIKMNLSYDIYLNQFLMLCYKKYLNEKEIFGFLKS